MGRIFEQRRAERGLDTPQSGPASGSELPAAELAALIADAPSKRPKNYWTLDRVLDALAEYVSEFEQTAPLRQKHYVALRAARYWPPIDAISRQAKAADIAGFQGMLTAARRKRRGKTRAA